MVQVKRSIAVLLAAFVAFSILFQVWELRRFVNAGGRFTDRDGQALCERVRALEQHSYGYQDAGKVPLNCAYGKP